MFQELLSFVAKLLNVFLVWLPVVVTTTTTTTTTTTCPSPVCPSVSLGTFAEYLEM